MRFEFSHRISRTALCAAAVLVALSLVIASCGDDDDPNGPPDDFVFATDSASSYARVDRMGMPAVATAVITSKDAYNAGDPTADAVFAGEIETNVMALHAALDDDLTGLDLTPCATMECVDEQVEPYVVPDVLRLDTAMPSGFPNGRALEDQVVDVTLALVLLDLGEHAVTTFADIPLNPPANDVSFSSAFPYLAPTNTNAVPAPPFFFAANPASEYTRVDRMGVPAVATALIASKDEYNAGDPVDDADFAEERRDNISALHQALDDDLEGLGFAPCATLRCASQLGQVAVPDVLTLDMSMAAGFPNGRRLPDQVIDLTLAVVLLHLDSLEVTTFADIPLNPDANDVDFLSAFPYLAESQ
jgi:Domain of unknown function (DUF4331)